MINRIWVDRLQFGVIIYFILLNFGRGLFHAYYHDSGAGSVAGLDLNVGGGVDIIFLLAAVGSRQVTIGLFELLIVFFASHLKRFIFLFVIIQTIIDKTNFKHPSTPVPGAIAHQIELITSIILLFLDLFAQFNARKPLKNK